MMINLNPQLLQAKGLSPADVLNAVAKQNWSCHPAPRRSAQFEYDVRVNAAPRRSQQLNDLPIKRSATRTIYLRDVATVSDGFAPQTNIVRQDGGAACCSASSRQATRPPSAWSMAFGDAAARRADVAPGVEDPAAGRSVDICARGDQRRHPRSDDRRLSDRG